MGSINVLIWVCSHKGAKTWAVRLSGGLLEVTVGAAEAKVTRQSKIEETRQHLCALTRYVGLTN